MGYDAIAPGYDEFVAASSIHQVAVPAVLDLCAEGSSVIDVACGQGVLTRELAGRYATVVGIDRSAELLRIATHHGESVANIRYIQADAVDLGQVGGPFDGATCCLALTDFDDLQAVAASMAQVLRPGGWLALATLHPCFEPPFATNTLHEGRTVKLVGNYFDEGRWWPADRSRLLANIGWHHRTLSAILNTFLGEGFQLDATAEPRGSEELVAVSPSYGEVAEVLALRWRLPVS